jgi:hypothetical protein
MMALLKMGLMAVWFTAVWLMAVEGVLTAGDVLFCTLCGRALWGALGIGLGEKMRVTSSLTQRCDAMLN